MGAVVPAVKVPAGRNKQSKRRIAMRNNEDGKIGWILLWAIGIPVPILVVLFLLRGCT
jgi:hypothetical protein